MNEATGLPQGLVLHAYGSGAEQVSGVLRSALNAVAALPDAAIEIVVQGPAVAALVTNGGIAEAVTNALSLGVAVNACENSMRAAGVEPGSLFPGVGSVPSAVAHLVQRQWGGWAYVRL